MALPRIRASLSSLLLLLLLVASICAPLVPSAFARTVAVSLYANYGDSANAAILAAEAAYTVEEPSLALSSTKQSVVSAVSNLYGSTPTVDYIVIAQEPDAVYSSTTSDLVAVNAMGITSFPVGGAAVVPIYNLPGRTIPLVLTRETFALIMLGEITRWDDSRLAELNSDLPSEDIEVVITTGTTSMTLALTRSLIKFNSTWSTVVGAASDTVTTWPTSKYAASQSFPSDGSMPSYIIATDYTFGYTNLANANMLDVSMAAMVNQAGYTVEATVETINYAVLEKAVVIDSDGAFSSWQQDVSDGTGYEVWPMTYMLGVYLPLSYSRTTCLARTEVVKFWRYFLSSSVVIDLANRVGVSVLPAITYTNLGLDTLLRTDILCEGSSVYTTAESIINVYGLQIATAFSDLDQNYLGFYGATDSAYTYARTSAPELQSVQQLEAREIDAVIISPSQFRFINPGVMEPFIHSIDDAAAGIATGDLFSLPYALYQIVPIFNLPDAVATAYAGSLPLVINMTTLGRIYAAQITQWTDPALEYLNPGLTAAFTATGASTNMTVVICCGTSTVTPVTNAFILALNTSSADFANVTTWTMPPDWTAMKLLATKANLSVVTVDSGPQIESAVNRIEGSIGFRLNYNNSIQADTNFAMQRTTVVGTLRPNAADPTAIVKTLYSTPGSLMPCAMAVTPSLDFSFKISNVVPTTSNVDLLAGCWPITFMTSMVIPANYTDTDSDSCLRANHTLNMVEWLINNQTLNEASKSRGVLRLSNITTMAALQLAALNAATCDGSTMLITLDTVWTLSSAITSFAWAMTVIGTICVAVSVGILAKYRHRAVLRSSSVPFQFVILAGLLLLFISIGVFGMRPATGQCQSLAWLINIGFTLTFGPLFAKMWRIYKIFDRRVLRVVKISNEKLGMMVATLVLVDIILNSAWQAVAPVYASPQLVTQNGVVWSYEQCTGDSESLPFLLVILGEKCLMLVFGSFMGFTTRNVSSTFNESKNVAWAIYNVFFSGAIIILVLIFSGVRGDSFVILIVMLIAWISFCTFGLNFGSKFIVLFRSDEANAAAMSAASHQSAEGVGSAQLFSFVPLIDVPKAILDRYIGALEAQMRLAKVRHQALIDDGGQGGVGFGPQYSQKSLLKAGGGGGGGGSGGGNQGNGSFLSKPRHRGGLSRGDNASRGDGDAMFSSFGGGGGGGDRGGGGSLIAPPSPADLYRVGDDSDASPDFQARRAPSLTLPPASPSGAVAPAERTMVSPPGRLRSQWPSSSDNSTLVAPITGSTALRASSRTNHGTGLVIALEPDDPSAELPMLPPSTMETPSLAADVDETATPAPFSPFTPGITDVTTLSAGSGVGESPRAADSPAVAPANSLGPIVWGDAIDADNRLASAASDNATGSNTANVSGPETNRSATDQPLIQTTNASEDTNASSP